MTPRRALDFLDSEIQSLEQQGLLRSHRPAPPSALVMCSNDYLGYAAEPWPDTQSHKDIPSGAGASRLVSGEHPDHALAEQTIASWLATESALLFTSGYAANVGTISALARPSDVVISDALNHASIIDGCRLSGATIVVVPHNNTDAVASALDGARNAQRRWVITESYFSMDGDIPNLARLRSLCDQSHAALVVDEAHAVGTMGPAGRGVCASIGITPDVLVGTLGKSVGLQGAFVAGPRTLRTWLWNRARSFVFSTGISPMLASAISQRIHRVAWDDSSRQRLQVIGDYLRTELAQIVGPALLPSHGPILPVLIGAPDAAVRISNRLRDRGVLVQAIRPPTVPTGTSRLRITAHAQLSQADLERFLTAFRDVWSEHVAPQAQHQTVSP